MRKTICIVITLTVLLVLPRTSMAGEVTGPISQIITRIDGLHYFYITGTASSKPGCATSLYWMIKDENSVAGKSQFSQILTAYATGRTVKIVGNNSCTRWPDGEDVSAVFSMPQ
ncbi:MAG: hypothetical protein COA47_14825 [Robiginitomaculum sp.]|nr:MAG: hypothetical protein COA47_14825 [Robiginitomaculum sp.]